MKTVLEVLESTADFFKKRGIESPRLNIDLLLAHVLGKKRMDLYLEFDRPLGDAELDRLREFVRRRAQGVPLQHLLGTVEFHGREFVCDGRALVPRPETEQFVERILALLPPVDGRYVDVGTGSGVIALTLAAERPAAHIQAVDLSADALALARENAHRLGLAERVDFLQDDLLGGSAGPFELIAANLPYIPAADLAGLSREVGHDPPQALNGGVDGLEIIARCIYQAVERLVPGGRLALEIGHDQGDRVREMLARAGLSSPEIAADYQGRDRFAFAVRS